MFVLLDHSRGMGEGNSTFVRKVPLYSREALVEKVHLRHDFRAIYMGVV